MEHVINNASNYLRNIPFLLAKTVNEAEEVGIKTAEAIIKERVFNEGRKMDGTLIGAYSSKPFYAEKSEFVVQGAFVPSGKNAKQIINKKSFIPNSSIPESGGVGIGRKQKFVDKAKTKERISMYLPGGYAQLRQIQGREIDFVNLQYSGDLNHSIQYSIIQDEATLAIYGSDQVAKKQKIETKYGAPIFSLSQAEREVTIESMDHYISSKVKTVL